MELFDFQEKAAIKLEPKRGALIAHDMGTGKTVTAIALDKRRRSSFDHPAKTLIICPLAVIESWVEHFRTWAPHLNVIAINNKNRKPFMEAMDASFQKSQEIGYDVFIMHYAAVRLEPDVARYPWFHVVCDEVHSLQDRKSSQTKAVKKISAFYKTGLSGTPVFNKPDDLWSILNWLYPKYWTSYWAYFKRYIKWVEYDGYRTIIGVDNEEELQSIIGGFYSRVKKEDVVKDLPNKYFSVVTSKMHPKQAKAYQQMKKDMLAWVGEHESDPINAPVVLAQLTRLQQFASAYAEIIKTTKKRRNCGECALVHINNCEVCLPLYREYELGIYELEEDELPDEFESTCEELKLVKCIGHPFEFVQLSEPSCKIDEAIAKIQESEGPVIVFSQFAQMAELLAKRCEKLGITCGLYTGKVPKLQRDQVVRDFQAGKIKVFAGSIKAGGQGLTLTASSTVMLLNREWAEALNDQAIDRAHRIGQKNAVHVIDVVTEDTLDENRNLDIALDWQVIKKLLGEL